MKPVPHCVINGFDHGPRYIIDGTNEEDVYEGDCPNPPFVVFDQLKQENVAGPFDQRADAEAALARFNAQG